MRVSTLILQIFNKNEIIFLNKNITACELDRIILAMIFYFFLILYFFDETGYSQLHPTHDRASKAEVGWLFYNRQFRKEMFCSHSHRFGSNVAQLPL